MIFLLFFIVLFTILFICHLKLRRIHEQVKSIPGPPLLPFIGNALEFGFSDKDVFDNMKRLCKQYGSVVRLCVGPQTFILLSEPKYIAQVLNLSETTDRPYFYKLFEPVVGNGLVMSSGEEWRRQRRIIEPMFSSKHLAHYMATFNENSKKLVEGLKPLANFDDVDVSDYVFKCAMTTIWNTAINADIKEDIDRYQKAFKYAVELSMKRFFSIFQRFDFTYKFTNDYKLLQKCVRVIQDYTQNIIAKRKRDLAKNVADKSRFLLLDNLLRLSGSDALTDEQIVDQIKTFMFTGSDTLGSTISFGLYELAKHPDVQKKILEETDLVLGQNKSADVTFEDAQYLHYTECVYKEILRLYPPGTVFMRKLQSNTKFDDLVVPAGACIIIFIVQTHLSENDFQNPERFDPNRHLPENSLNRHSHAFIPYGGGPRICIGQRYSILEAKVMLAKLVRHFEIFPAEPEHKLILTLGGSLKPANGLPIKLKLRENI